MSRTSLHRPRRNRAVWDRPATGTRLLPTIPQLNPHYKRCLKVERLRPRSDQPSFPPVPVTGYGRFPDSPRQALLQDSHCRCCAPLAGSTYVAGIDLAGETEGPGISGPRAVEPLQDSTVVTIGELQSTNDGIGSVLPSLRVVEHFWWTGKPHTETFSHLVHILKNVWGFRRVVADATGIGAGADALLRNRPGPSIPSPSLFLVIPAAESRNPSPGWGRSS